MSCHFLLQGIFPALGSNPDLLHCRWILFCWATVGSWSSRAVGQRFWASFVGDNFRKQQQCQSTRILTLPMANTSVLTLSSSVSNVPGTVPNTLHEFSHLNVILLNVHQLCEVGTNNLSLLQIDEICKCCTDNNWWVQEAWFFWLSSWKYYYLLSIYHKVHITLSNSESLKGLRFSWFCLTKRQCIYRWKGSPI